MEKKIESINQSLKKILSTSEVQAWISTANRKLDAWIPAEAGAWTARGGSLELTGAHIGPSSPGWPARRWQVPSPPTSACSEHQSSVPIRYSDHELSSDSCHSSGNIWLYPETLFGCHDYGKGDRRPETLPESTVHGFPFQRHQQGWDGSRPSPIKGDLVTKKMCPGRSAHSSCSST